MISHDFTSNNSAHQTLVAKHLMNKIRGRRCARRMAHRDIKLIDSPPPSERRAKPLNECSPAKSLNSGNLTPPLSPPQHTVSPADPSKTNCVVFTLSAKVADNCNFWPTFCKAKNSEKNTWFQTLQDLKENNNRHPRVRFQ